MDDDYENYESLSDAVSELVIVAVKHSNHDRKIDQYGVICPKDGKYTLYIRDKRKREPMDPIRFMKSREKPDKMVQSLYDLVKAGWRVD